MKAFYNEIEPYAAQWTRNLIAAGHVAAGRVDERSIRDVQPADVADATQAHFFAGIACWSYALRLAGWPDDRPVWTGSCPCQPFSVAGKRGGTADERHLWPEWFRLIREQRPPVVFGEQVASPDGLAWLDTVSADLEASGYAFAAADLCAAGVGAPHIRQRLYFVAYALPAGRPEGRRGAGNRPTAGSGVAGLVAHATETRRTRGENTGANRDSAGTWRGGVESQRGGADGLVGDALRNGGGRHAGATGGAQAPVTGAGQGARGVGDEPVATGAACVVGDADHARSQGRRDDAGEHAGERAARAPGVVDGVADSDGRIAGDRGLQRGGRHDEWSPDALARHWRDVEWIACSDGVARPTQPGLFPLAHGATARVGRLRAYGNAIVPQVAATFIRAAMDVLP